MTTIPPQWVATNTLLPDGRLVYAFEIAFPAKGYRIKSCDDCGYHAKYLVMETCTNGDGHPDNSRIWHYCGECWVGG